MFSRQASGCTGEQCEVFGHPVGYTGNEGDINYVCEAGYSVEGDYLRENCRRCATGRFSARRTFSTECNKCEKCARYLHIVLFTISVASLIFLFHCRGRFGDPNIRSTSEDHCVACPPGKVCDKVGHAIGHCDNAVFFSSVSDRNWEH